MPLKFDTILKITGFPVKEAKTFFIKSLSADKTSWQNVKKWNIFRYHYENNEFYRNFAGKNHTDWNEIPILKPGDLKGDYLTKIPQELKNKRLFVSSTSGSSGTPLYFSQDLFTHALVWENVRVKYEYAAISVDDYQARMFGMSKKPLHIAKARIKDYLANRYRFNVLDLSDKAFEKWIKKFKKGKFDYIYGYTNSIVTFAHYCINNNIVLKSIAPSLKCCIVTSEMCTDYDSELIRKGFGIPVFNEYGTSEQGILGFKKDNYWNCSDELIYYEVLDENGNILPDGERGFLTCTSLFNKATPFIRYQFGDLASIERVNGQTRILELFGRTNDLAILPNGFRAPGISFYFVVQNLVDTLCNIREFLFRQTPEGFNFEYVADNPITDEDFKKISKMITLHFKVDIPLKAVKLDKLERGKNGKFKSFISSIN